MNFHQIMGTDLHVERFGEMSGFQPRRDAADAGNVYLNDGATTALQIFAEMGGMIKRLADRYGQGGRLRQTHVSVDIFRWQRLLEPGEVELFESFRSSDRLRD